MRTVLTLLVGSTLMVGPEAHTLGETETGDVAMEMTSLTPVLYVEAIEPVLDFWKRLGFEVTAEVPEGDRLGFVILRSDPVEIMYQTRISVEKDVPDLADTPMGGSLLFIQVSDLDAVVAALEEAEVIVPRRTTFYGADEIAVREPGGNLVTFAHFAERGEG